MVKSGVQRAFRFVFVIVVTGAIIVALWWAVYPSKKYLVSDEKQIAHGQDKVLAQSCACPGSAGDPPVQGRINAVAVLGEQQTEANRPYTAMECAANARDTLRYLQDEHLFQWAQSVTRDALTEFPPSQLYYTWDQNAKRCEFFFNCPGLTGCGDPNLATGLVGLV